MNIVYKDEVDDLVIETKLYLIYQEPHAGGYLVFELNNKDYKWQRLRDLEIPNFSYENPDFEMIEDYLNRYFKLKSFW